MYQKLIIAGNLGKDPEMRYQPDGTPVTTLSVATSRKWNNPDGPKGEETTWFKVTLWRNNAESAAKYLTKGSKVLIEGRLTPDKETGGPKVWTRQDGSAGASYEVTAERYVMLGGGERNEDAPAKPAAKSIKPEPRQEYADDDIPF